MKVFISWSGSLSHQVATALHDWLPLVITATDPYLASEDIDKGSRWSTDIARELEHSAFGILCVTRENVDAPWLNFEAGAISKLFDQARVAPFLFNVDRASITGLHPLLQFQSTTKDKEDVRKLVHSLNTACGENAIDDPRLDEIFDMWWPRLVTRLDAIPLIDSHVGEGSKRSQYEMSAELFELVRDQHWTMSDPERLVPAEYIRSVLDVSAIYTKHDRAVDHLFSAIDTLSMRESRVLQLRFGLLDGQPATLEEVAREFGVTAERITEIEERARVRLRHPSRRRAPQATLFREIPSDDPTS